jgi:hypothetical protein
LYVVADQLAFPLDATPPGVYRQRGTSSLQRLFKTHFPDLVARYEAEFAERLGKFRLQRISKAVEAFLQCGDYSRGLARIVCTSPDCDEEYFRPFSCKVFHLCPSCSQKRTLLLGEYMNERLMLLLPHRQVVFTFPKVLRVFFRYDRRLYGELCKLVYPMMQRFYTQAASRPLQGAAVIAYASAGDFVRWNPHLHALFLEGGFDDEGHFVHVPSLDLDKLSAYFRSAVIGFFLERRLINERLAKNMLDWTHSGFSVDLTVKIPATSPTARVSLAQYIARAPLSLKKMLVEEHGASVLYRSEFNPYFGTDQKLFPAIGFLVDLLQHLPDAGSHLIRRYGLYSSRSRATWSEKPHLVRLAPEGWKEQHGLQSKPQPAQPDHQEPVQSVSAQEARSAWARLIAKVFEVDPLRCRRCGSKMRIKAVITDPQQVRRILRHLVKTGAAPPDLDLSSLS